MLILGLKELNQGRYSSTKLQKFTDIYVVRACPNNRNVCEIL